jgi:hypothetical protein
VTTVRPGSKFGTGAEADAEIQNPAAALASSNARPNLKFEREDWSLYRTVEGLCQKAGVPKAKLVRLVLKELTDNGLDAGAGVDVGSLGDSGYYAADDGGGIDGMPEEIARLFSISRPMISTKLLRLPTRGALGNGLRVVAGAVLASEGSLCVTTNNRRVVLRPERDGTTSVVSAKKVNFPTGTRVEISFGPALMRGDDNPLDWANLAVRLSTTGEAYAGRSSPWWYDVPQFQELLYGSGDTPVRELISQLDGCSGGKAGEIVATAGLSRATCRNVERAQAERLLLAARGQAKQVNPLRLGNIGPDVFKRAAYASAHGVAKFGAITPLAEIPFVVEAWAKAAEGDATNLTICVNRTPIPADVDVSRDRRDIDVFGCGLSHTVAKVRETAHFTLCLNVITPFMPITSDGKEPDLEPFLHKIGIALKKAISKAHRPDSGSKHSQKDVILENLDEVIAAVSGDGAFRFNARQILYRMRPLVMEELGQELQLTNFTSIITDYENEVGEIPGMYREPRGTLYHPHRGETISLGTLMVEKYERPAWTFNKIVYIEKEGAAEALKAVRWGERHDCAVLSSKGFSTRAARDLIDKLVEHDEPVQVFCVHDADAAGTMIYQTLQEETKARAARKIQIINLGLEPWEAIDMGLEAEPVEAGKRRKAVAQYVIGFGDEDWVEWLQTNRVELNAMTTPQFIAWLDAKMDEHGDGKLVPPGKVAAAELKARIEKKVRDALVTRILREAGFEQQVGNAIKKIKTPAAIDLVRGIKRLAKQEPDREWRDHIEAEAERLADQRKRLDKA